MPDRKGYVISEPHTLALLISMLPMFITTFLTIARERVLNLSILIYSLHINTRILYALELCYNGGVVEFFNKTFFRFAFGFIGVILFSIVVILVANTIQEKRGEGLESESGTWRYCR